MAAKSTRRDAPVELFVGASLLLEPFKHWLWIGLALPLVTGIVVHRWRRDFSLAVLVAATAASHYPADLITSSLELSHGAPDIGLSWYRYPLADFVIEGALLAVGWWFYARPRTTKDWRSDPWQLPLLATLLCAQAIFSFLVAPNVV